MQQIQYIKINQLHESSMNPRKEYDQEGIDQLAESIRQVGILQPIIARLNTSVKKKTIPIYEVICGARRLAAAGCADLTEVPVIVRELTDEEAFDLMITENLQRKDVSPLEEALAFQSLIDKGKYDHYSLSDRFGKSVTYIRQRIKLNDLIQEFKELLIHDVITVSHAFEISKLEVVYQEEIFKGDFEDRGRNWSCPTVKQLKYGIERRFTLELKNATFKLDDITLNTAAGSCTDCPKNTGSSASLFPDENGHCLDRICFINKTTVHLAREIERIQNEEPEVIIGIPGYVYGEEEKQAQKLKEKGVPVVEISWSNGFQEVTEPELPEMPSADDYGTPEDYEEAMEDYNSEMEEYEENLKEYQEKVASGRLRKVFMAVGNEKGKTLLYELNSKAATKVDAATGAEISRLDQIKELQEKDKRNAEIAFEKTYNDARKLLEDNPYGFLDRELTPIEWQAVYIILLDNIGYGSPLKQELNPKGNGSFDNKDLALIASKLSINQINRLFRAFIINKLGTSSPNYNKSEANAFLQIMSEYFPDLMKEIELKHNGVYLKRKESIENKIAELKTQ